MPRKAQFPVLSEKGDMSNLTIVQTDNKWSGAPWVVLTNDGKLWTWAFTLKDAVYIVSIYALSWSH